MKTAYPNNVYISYQQTNDKASQLKFEGYRSQSPVPVRRIAKLVDKYPDTNFTSLARSKRDELVGFMNKDRLREKHYTFNDVVEDIQALRTARSAQASSYAAPIHKAGFAREFEPKLHELLSRHFPEGAKIHIYGSSTGDEAADLALFLNDRLGSASRKYPMEVSDYYPSNSNNTYSAPSEIFDKRTQTFSSVVRDQPHVDNFFRLRETGTVHLLNSDPNKSYMDRFREHFTPESLQRFDSPRTFNPFAIQQGGGNVVATYPMQLTDVARGIIQRGVSFRQDPIDILKDLNGSQKVVVKCTHLFGQRNWFSKVEPAK